MQNNFDRMLLKDVKSWQAVENTNTGRHSIRAANNPVDRMRHRKLSSQLMF